MKLYNTFSRSVEEVQPHSSSELKMYTCGLTVYSQPQIGNWVAYIYADVLTRTLKDHGFNVTRIQNITDVGHLVSDDDSGEDKMEKGAKKEGLTAWEVAEKYINIADIEAYSELGLLRPDKLIRATALIPEQISFVQDLESKGYTYTIADEGVYFDTSKLSDYGRLARLDIEGLQQGARVEVSGKRNVTDFALWKFSPIDQTRDMEWESPWGKGFPGWHLECSVIARTALGDQIDLHTGGIDHIPVHHTNEIAQTESVTGKQFVKYWFHNNHMKVNGAKLAKSSGNSYTLNDIKEKDIDLQAFKILVLSSHYRTEGNFSWEILEAQANRLRNIKEVVALRYQALSNDTQIDFAHHTQMVHDALGNDLDTPAALAAINTALDSCASGIGLNQISEFVTFIEYIDATLGLSLSTLEDVNENIKTILEQRHEARTAKNWELSDTLRDELAGHGIGVRDSAVQQSWYYL